MFPDVRLMIAATLASIVALMCGFGMFAAFRVSHEPLGRLPPAGTPMQLVADNAARPSTTIVPGEIFDRRFQIAPVPMVSQTTSSAARGPDLDDDVETSPGATPAVAATDVAVAPDETSALGEPKDQAALPAIHPTEAPAETVVDATATAPASEQPKSTPPPEAVSVTAISDIDGAPSGPATETGDAGRELKSPIAPAPRTEPTVAPSVAAVEPEQDWRRDLVDPRPERSNAAAGPASMGTPAVRTSHETTAKEPRRIRLAARPLRPRRMASAGVFRATDQYNGFGQSNFHGAPQTQNRLVRRLVVVRIRSAKVAPAPTQERASAIGGPYVSPPGQ
jgi:hypothetical protein